MNTQQQPKAKNGQFRKLSKTERIRRDAAKGLTVAEIAKARGIQYQTVWRTIHRAERHAVVASKVEKATDGVPTCDNADCLNGKSHICECRCMGAYHGFGQNPQLN